MNRICLLRLLLCCFALLASVGAALGDEPADTAPAGAAVASPRAADAGLALPPPLTDGPFSIERTLHERRSLRSPASTPLSLAQIGQLCWAAQGVTDAKGHRTAPSALATYPLELYVLAAKVDGLPPGLYHYEPRDHALSLRGAGDRLAAFDAAAVGQGWTAGAPAMFLIVGRSAAMERMRDRGAQFMWVEAGLAAQGFFLQATALGLGSTYVGGFDPDSARASLGLADGEEVLAVLPVGKKP